MIQKLDLVSNSPPPPSSIGGSLPDIPGCEGTPAAARSVPPPPPSLATPSGTIIRTGSTFTFKITAPGDLPNSYRFAFFTKEVFSHS
ncbi:hypothetical protein ACKKBG_A01490 [Auxenochlorella protothecoides x Auxenochlorella symbiontica]